MKIRRIPTASGGPPSGLAGGELAGTYPNPTVLAAHSGSTHAATEAAAEATAAAAAAVHVALADAHHARQHSSTSASDHTFPGGTTTFLRADGTYAAVTATPPVLVGPNNLVSTVEIVAANTYVHVGRQLEIASTGSIEIPATSTLEITA